MFEIIIAGFGGQGVLSLGQILAYSAMTEGKETSWLPSYGPEMRGGTTNCSVIISDDAVASPVIVSPDILIAMNKPSLNKFIDRVKCGGVVFVNSSLIDEKVQRQDIKSVYVPANELAHELGTEKAANIFMLGVINKVCNILKSESIYKGIEYGFGAKQRLIELNKTIYDEAFKRF